VGPDVPIRALLDACLAGGQSSAWGEFIRRFHPVIAGTVTKTARNWVHPTTPLVEELTQETYLRLCGHNYRILRDFVPEHEDSIYGFLKAVAFSVTHDYFRVAYAGKRGAGRADAPLNERLVAAQGMTEVEKGILMDEIAAALNELANPETRERDRRIFVLHYRDGLTSKAIADLPEMGLGQKGVEAILQRLIGRMRKHFAAGAGR
jgi:RNA polymerase sigma-70 factor (ECF subfamily)